MTMTEEVGRLHREKQVVENQISDLFAFYTKQKSAAPVSLYLVFFFFKKKSLFEINKTVIGDELCERTTICEATSTTITGKASH